MFLFILLFLPLLEIAGFIVVGGKIGIGLSLLWVILDVMAGFLLLCSIGPSTLRRARKSVDEDVYPFEEMFDGLCVITGALLLIYPGFVSDLIALPLLVPPVRHWLFRFLKYRHSSFFNDLGHRSRGFTHWYYEERGDGGVKTIEGEVRHLDEEPVEEEEPSEPPKKPMRPSRRKND